MHANQRPAKERRHCSAELQNHCGLASLFSSRRRSQVVRRRSAKPLFVGSIPTGASLCRDDLRAPTAAPR